VVEQEGYGVREHLAHQPAHQVPQITCPHPLCGVALGELAKNGVYPVAKTAQQGTPSGSRISLLGGVWGQKLHAHRHKLFFCFGRVVVAVSYDHPRGKLGKFWKHGELMGVGRGHREAGDHPRPADPYVHPKAIEGLPEQCVLAKSGLAAETPAAISAGKQACRQGHRIADGEGGVVGGVGRELLPEAFLNLPEVGRLPGEGGAMHPQQVREEVGVVAPEVRQELRVFIESQELADDLDGEYFRVGERWGGSAASDAPLFETVVDKAESGDDEGAKIHKRRPPATSFGAIGTTPSVGRSSVLLKSSKKPAHRVT
jgi:hypothetical protein